MKFWPKLQILELSPAVSPLKSVDIDTLESLKLHPGWIYLTQQLDIEAQVLKSKLSSERHESIREVDFLQSGIYWWKRLQTKLDALLKVPRANIRPAQDDELEMFTRMSQNLKVVGL